MLFRSRAAHQGKAGGIPQKRQAGVDVLLGDPLRPQAQRPLQRLGEGGEAAKINAEIAGISGSTGQIKAGLQADLLLIDGKPDLDISSMYHVPFKVWKRGKLVRDNSGKQSAIR